MSSQKWCFYLATIINPKTDTKCDFFAEGMLVAKSHRGKWKIHDLLTQKTGLNKYKKQMNTANTFKFADSVIMPGFFDMHFHWVQDDVRVKPKDSLLEWLEKYTFPSEMKFADNEFAIKTAKTFFSRLISTGTIGGACYSSIHEGALDAAMKYAQGNFVIGNVLMTMNSPKELTQNIDEAIELSKKLVKKYKTKYCFTPRFAISTHPKVMQHGSKVADKNKVFKQSHLCETPSEIKMVQDIYKKFPGFENSQSYTEIYRDSGMLGKRSLMGHAIHLTEHEIKILKKTDTVLIHCPTSNAPLHESGLNSGLFNFERIDRAKIRWALGSDIGAGPFLSMFDVMRSFVMQNKRKKAATFINALYRSTLAGAKILGLDKLNGNLAKGKNVNFLVIPFKTKKKVTSAEKILQGLITPHNLQREKYDGLTSHVYLNAKLVYKKNSGLL